MLCIIGMYVRICTTTGSVCVYYATACYGQHDYYTSYMNDVNQPSYAHRILMIPVYIYIYRSCYDVNFMYINALWSLLHLHNNN